MEGIEELRAEMAAWMTQWPGVSGWSLVQQLCAALAGGRRAGMRLLEDAAYGCELKMAYP